ncbi:MAG TPA: type III-B CRISPR module RAMP protein Cmr4 [Bryobacteraceae bacterium]|jgi:CRISPR-associated protein Cmr4|nr:type III-B CRISPR module RAMP protein Cmr4 [Bryobacteraceae bacterium]
MAHTKLYWLHALTPLHVGAGFGLGFIDLPIMREKITNWPIVPGSAIKGVMADYYKASDSARTKGSLLAAAFGRGGEENANSGSLVFSDARIVCLAVPSMKGTFAWVTSKLALLRLRRDMQAAGIAPLPPEPWDVGEDEAHIPQPQGTPAGSALNTREGKVFLCELDLNAREKPAARAWAETLAKAVFPGDATWQAEFVKRFTVVSGDTFGFLSETGTEVNARVRIDEQNKTVKKGQLWYEEYLPAESILAGLVWCDKVYGPPGTDEDALLAKYCASLQTLQMGGKATTGKGRVRFVSAAQQAAGGAR